jgi:hypothetical protein
MCKAACGGKLCGQPCAREDVGHATHNPKVPKATFVANTDLNGNTRPQHAVFMISLYNLQTWTIQLAWLTLHS